MTTSNKDNIFHAADPQASLVSEPHTVIDISDYPFAEIAESDRVLLLRREWEI